MTKDDDEFWNSVAPVGSDVRRTYKCRMDQSLNLAEQFHAINILDGREKAVREHLARRLNLVMSVRPSVELCPSTQEVHFEGPAVPAAGWRRHPLGLHCVQFRVSGFRGTVHVEATLDLDPATARWFPAVDPVVFPRPGSQIVGESATVGLTFSLNAVWLRVRVDRRGLVQEGARPDFVQAAVGRFDGARLGV